MRAAGKVLLLGVGALAVFAAVSLTYKLDEWLGCDLGDHPETCISGAAAALRNWFTASDYEKFLVGGPDHEAFVNSAKASCVAYHKDKRIAVDKTEEQTAIFCGCYANNLGALASARDLRYLARHEQAPAALQQRLDDLAPDCARLANSFTSPQ